MLMLMLMMLMMLTLATVLSMSRLADGNSSPLVLLYCLPGKFV